MRRLRTLATLAIVGSTDRDRGVQLVAPAIRCPPPAPYVPIVPAYLQADVIGGHAARLKKARAAGLKALNPAVATDYVSRQEIDLRRETAGTGVDVIRSGDMLLLRLPATGTFDVGKSDDQLASAFDLGRDRAHSEDIQSVVRRRPRPHRFDRNEASNKVLSERRAQAVAAHLRSRGVRQARIATRGYGASRADRRQFDRRRPRHEPPGRDQDRSAALARRSYRRASKNSRSSAANSASPMPPSTSGR